MRQCALALALMAIIALCASTAFGKSSQGSNTTVTCYTAFDADYFYFAAVVKKPTLTGSQATPFSDPLKDDAISVYLQTEDAVSTTRSARSVQMTASVAGGVQLYRGASGTPLTGFGDFVKSLDGSPRTFKFGVTRRGEIGAPASNQSGYSVEIGIPWVEIGGAPQVGQKLKFNVVSHNASGSGPTFLSLSKQVALESDINNPSKWNNIVFVDAPVKSIDSAPGAQVCYRLFSAKPLIDGVVEEAVWSAISSFSFAEANSSSKPAEPSIAARLKTKEMYKPGRIPVLPLANSDVKPISRPKEYASSAVFTTYRYDFQNDPRKDVPFASIRTEVNSIISPTYPLDGMGPWMSFDRIDWHRKQMEQIKSAGIQVVLPIYRADLESRRRYSLRGLHTLVGALNYSQNNGVDVPLLGCFLKTDSLGTKGSIDVSAPEGLRILSEAIHSFFRVVPRKYRFNPVIGSASGSRPACFVYVDGVIPFSNWSLEAANQLKNSFLKEFGQELILAGSTDFGANSGLDSVVDITGSRGYKESNSGWIKSASMGPGFDNTLTNPTENGILSRKDGNTYRDMWKRAMSSACNFVFIDSWNDFINGSDIAPSFQYGMQYIDLTRAYSVGLNRAAKSTNPVSVFGCDLPHDLIASKAYDTHIRIENTGFSSISPEAYSISLSWTDKNGSPIGTATEVSLGNALLPGTGSNLNVGLSTPGVKGSYSLVLKIQEIKTGKTQPTSISTTVIGDFEVHGSDDNLSGITTLIHDIPSALESGGSYDVRLLLRNDSNKTWLKSGGQVSIHLWQQQGSGYTPVETVASACGLANDVQPGQSTVVSLKLHLVNGTGSPISVLGLGEPLQYACTVDFTQNDSANGVGCSSDGIPVQIVPQEFGVRFTTDVTPRELPGDRRVPVRIGIRNLGPQTWLKDRVRVGYHWYYLDGTEAIWQDETTPLPVDVPPGGQIPDMLAWVTPPPYDGTYWLEWDVMVGDVWASTLPSARPYDIAVHQIQIVKGRLQFLDISKSFNANGYAMSTDIKPGSADGFGRAIAAELSPPYVLTDTIPSTAFLPSKGVGVDSSRKISFKWASRSDQTNNLIECKGQTITLSDIKKQVPGRVFHLLAMSTGKEVVAPFNLIFEDNTEQLTSVVINGWVPIADNQSEIAHYFRYTRLRSVESPDKPVAIYHYSFKISDSKRIASIRLPNSPDVKIAAITIEK